MRRDVALLDACARGDDRAARFVSTGSAPACLSLGRMQPMTDVDARGMRARRRRRRAPSERRTRGAARPGGHVLGGVQVERPGLRRDACSSRARGSMAPSRPAWASSAFAPRPERCPRTSVVTRARVPRSRTASPTRPLTSSSTTVAASWSAARRRGARARSSSTVRCCWSHRARRATSTATRPTRRRRRARVARREVTREELVDALAEGLAARSHGSRYQSGLGLLTVRHGRRHPARTC